MKLLLVLSLAAACTTEANLGNSIVAGRAEWSLALGGRGYEQGDAVAIDATGDVIVGGLGHLGTIDFGTGPIGTLGTWAFLAKRAGSDGSPVWEVAMTGIETDAMAQITDIALGTDGSIYATGEFMGTVDFGGTRLTTPYHVNGDLFVAKYSSDGALVWVHGLGPNSDAMGLGIAVDAFDNLYVAGHFRVGTFGFLGATYTSGDPDEGFLASFTGDGVERWIVAFDPSVSSYVTSVAASATGDIVFDGYFSSAISFGGQVIQAASASRGFLARYHADGSYVWAEGIGASGAEIDLGQVTVDGTDQIVVQATTRSAGFAPPPGFSLMAFGPDGAERSTYTQDGQGAPGGHAVRADGAIVSPEWVDSNNADTGQTDGHLELSAISATGDASSVSIGKRLLQASNGTGMRDTAVGPHGEFAVVGDLAGEVLVGPTPIAAHGTNDTDALVILIPPAD